MQRLTAGLLLTAVAATANAQDMATKFESAEVVPGIHMIKGADGFGGGNMGLLVGDDFVAMIDDGIEPLAPKLLSRVSKLADRPVNFLINTHVHADHTGGNAQFADSGIVIFAHDNIRSRLVLDSSPAGGAAGLPVITFAEGMSFHLGGIDATVMHLPQAHTDGDAVIYFPEHNVLHTGDIFFNGLFPFIDLDNGGSVDGYIAAQRVLLEMANDATRIIPGHGPLGNKSDLEKDLRVLIESRARVLELVQQGKSEDEIVTANPLAEFHDVYNWGFITTERITRTLVRSLSSEN